MKATETEPEVLKTIDFTLRFPLNELNEEGTTKVITQAEAEAEASKPKTTEKIEPLTILNIFGNANKEQILRELGIEEKGSSEGNKGGIVDGEIGMASSLQQIANQLETTIKEQTEALKN